jgi:hypothetical protein
MRLPTRRDRYDMTDSPHVLYISRFTPQMELAVGTKLKTTDPTSRQRGRPTSTDPQQSKNTQRERRGKFGHRSQMGA